MVTVVDCGFDQYGGDEGTVSDRLMDQTEFTDVHGRVQVEKVPATRLFDLERAQQAPAGSWSSIPTT